MLKLISRLFDPMVRRLAPPAGLGRKADTVPASPPVAARNRRLLVCRSALPVTIVPRPVDGPYSQAAYERWQRAESRLRQERRRSPWLAVHGIDTGPRLIHDMVVR
ncbi:hypothetical protein F0344_21175 [Streptomyces finlayi]|uniref:Uncharacterized protein n=1 Tax=Streptomyces finlayi TaxID=67296 RepID=A0A7G7BN81_9ACTN|nr:hypothetical protein [Streptomyces finlayi]QNE76796.1 hypothetical protein F0344_21175 [Streptomyces finlayi]